MAATVKDVARIARVSTQTVSRVLNDSAFVAPETRARVRQAMTRLGYHPDAVARSLRQRHTRTIGLLFANIHNPGFVSELRGIDEVTRGTRHGVLLCNSNEMLEEEQRLAGTLIQQRVDGVLFIPVGPDSARTLHLFRAARIPVVVLNRSLPRTDIVMYANRDAGRLAASHLIGLGHRRLGVVSAPLSISTAQERCSGCRDALVAHGLPPGGLTIEEACFDWQSGRAATLRLLDRPFDQRPTGLIALTNFAVLGALRALGERGLCVPEDVALVAFGDPDWAAVATPPLTTIAADPTLLGRQAAAMLMERMQGKRRSRPGNVLVPMELRVRRSCGAASASGRTGREVARAIR
jgi:LacI family transcriptional regulator